MVRNRGHCSRPWCGIAPEGGGGGGSKHLRVAESNISLMPGENEDQRLEQSDSSTPDSPGVGRHKLPTMDPFTEGKEPQGLGKGVAH